MKNNEQKYHGAWPVLVTPYDDNLKIDVPAYREMIEWYMDKNIGGIYANCLSSEMYELDDSEKLLLITEAIKTVNGRIPVVATGNFGENTEEHIDYVKKVGDTGVDTVMLTVPVFCEDDACLEEYFCAVADNTEVNLGFYECPNPRTYHLGVKLVETLAKTGRFNAYKETSCDIDKIKKIIEVTKDTPLAILQANVPYLVEAAKAGAHGSMNIVANWLPELVAEVLDKAISDPQTAELLLSYLIGKEMAQRSVHPMGVKYLMSKRGVRIKPLTRYPRELSKEEAYGLDQAAKVWFNDDGSLAVFNRHQL